MVGPAAQSGQLFTDGIQLTTEYGSPADERLKEDGIVGSTKECFDYNQNKGRINLRLVVKYASSPNTPRPSPNPLVGPQCF